MILTKDNLLRYVREKKYVTPTNVAENFDTSTTIASAALSEIAKEKTISITYFKLSSSPYYYDPRQSECLIEIGEKHFSSYDKEIFTMLKNSQVVNDSSLSIQLRLAVERIKDFAIPLEINFEDSVLKFWVWYLRDISETKKQILEVLNPVKKTEEKKSENKQPTKAPITREIKEQVRVEKEEVIVNPFENNSNHSNESKSELFIENYFKKNYLKVENKNKEEKTIEYNVSLTVNKLKILFDSIYFLKKPTDADILKFYMSSQKPKIIFIENAPKKIYKLAESLDNLEIVNI